VLAGLVGGLVDAGGPLGGAGSDDGSAGAAPSVPTALATSPLFHVGGLHSGFCTQLTVGAKVVFSEGRFDPVQVMELIERERVHLWGAIPTMLHRVVHHERIGDYDLSSLRSISFGGAPTPAETIDKAREVLRIQPSFTNAYGLTETHGVATTNGGRSYLEKQASVGRPVPLLDMKVVDENGNAVPDGEPGELLFYGPLITPGYWNRPEATAETVRDGWLHTGDIGYKDADGFFWVSDRAKDMILRGGENVYCQEIESVLADHPEIDEAAVIGVPDPELGERVKAVVVRVPGSELTAGAAQKHVASRMAGFKVPELVEFRDAPLPRNPAGKILKNLLRGEGGSTFAQEDLD
jgi:long-chain acyl-CoA synthetase